MKIIISVFLSIALISCGRKIHEIQTESFNATIKKYNYLKRVDSNRYTLTIKNKGDNNLYSTKLIQKDELVNSNSKNLGIVFGQIFKHHSPNYNLVAIAPNRSYKWETKVSSKIDSINFGLVILESEYLDSNSNEMPQHRYIENSIRYYFDK